MRKLIGYIPAALFTAFYLYVGMTGAGLTLSMILIWIGCLWLSSFFLHKGLFWGSVFGFIPAIHMIYMGTQYTGHVINVEIPLGIILILFLCSNIQRRNKRKCWQTAPLDIIRRRTVHH